MKKRVADKRDPLVPLTPPVFGVPPLAAQCAACGLWFPWANYYRKPNRGRPQPTAQRCKACIEARVMAPRT